MVKQVEIIVNDNNIPLSIYELLYRVAPTGFVERKDNFLHRFVLFIEEDALDTVLNQLNVYDWITEIKIGDSVEEEGWLSSWRDNYKPIVVPPFKIIPSWLKNSELVEGYIPIYINSGIAFGTGEHETTRLSLRLLASLNVKGKSVLDIGTGSGILAIAAAKLGATVEAFDLDPVAVEVARENIKLNGVDDIRVFVDNALKYNKGSYDIVIANLVWSILSEIPFSIKKLASGGLLIASGILSEQLSDFIELYEKAGFTYIKHIEENDWVGVLLSG